MTSELAYTDRDDAQHPFDTPGYYEWWYFDVETNDGYTVTLALLCPWTDKEHTSGVDLAIYTPDGKALAEYKPLKRADCRVSQQKCDVRMPTGYCRQEGPDTYQVAVGDAKLGIDLFFHRTIPGWKLTPTGLMVDDATGKQGWVNAIPKGEVEGWLLIDGRRVPVKGTGYHDHNWGNTDMGNSFAGWVWGRAFAGTYTLVYGWLTPLEAGKQPEPFVTVFRDKEVVFACDMKMKLLASATHAESGTTYPTDLEWTGKAPWGTELTCRLTMEKLLAYDKGEGSSGKPIHYFRRVSDVTADVVVNGQKEHATGRAIDEYTTLA